MFEDTARLAYIRNLRWLFGQIDMFIKRRRLELIDKKPGAVYTTDPKIVYVKMLKRPTLDRNLCMDKLHQMRGKLTMP